MPKTILYISMSLDGYLADISGKVDFLQGDNSDPLNLGTYDDFFNSIETIILGYKTYNQIITEISPNNWVYSGKKTYVLTNDISDLEKSTNEIIFTTVTPENLIKSLRNTSKGDIWIAGGANLANTFIELNEIDQFNIAIIPVILGNGIKLFNFHENKTKLKLLSTKTYNGIVELIYSNRKE